MSYHKTRILVASTRILVASTRILVASTRILVRYWLLQSKSIIDSWPDILSFL